MIWYDITEEICKDFYVEQCMHWRHERLDTRKEVAGEVQNVEKNGEDQKEGNEEVIRRHN